MIVDHVLRSRIAGRVLGRAWSAAPAALRALIARLYPLNVCADGGEQRGQKSAECTVLAVADRERYAQAALSLDREIGGAIGVVAYRDRVQGEGTIDTLAALQQLLGRPASQQPLTSALGKTKRR